LVTIEIEYASNGTASTDTDALAFVTDVP